MSELQMHRELVLACQAGDSSAQYKLYKQYSKAMFNICCRMVNNAEDAEDILQNSFVDVFKGIHRYRFESTIGAWIKRIVINNCINFLKRKKIRFGELNEELYRIPEEKIAESSLNVDAVYSGIEKLPDGYRVVLSLYLLEGYDHREISEILKISEATSKSQFSRAKRKLKDLIQTEMSYI